jgi:hypothetical protein
MPMSASIVALCALGFFFFLLVRMGAKPTPTNRLTDSAMVNSGNRDKELASRRRN